MKLELIEIQNAKQTIDSKNIKGISTTLENNVLHVLENNSLIIKLSQNDWGYCTISKNATEIVSNQISEILKRYFK